jgi:hypothetical protein
VGGLAKFLEDEGLATVAISLVREHTARLRPPRALWVPFPLGRPFGVPDNPNFQRKVLTAALDVLDASSGPVIVDFAADAPGDAPGDDMAGWVCPVSFPKPPPATDATGLREAVLAEIGQLAPWYQMGRERRGRSAVGLSGLAMADAARFLDAWLAGETRQSPIEGVGVVDALRWSAEDLKAFYLEAATAQPGTAGRQELLDWMWRRTSAGEMLKALRKVLLADDDPGIHDIGDFMLVPEAYHD